jgi:hypothetical protein
LTRKTAANLKQGIALAELPLTFQHAIEVTRRLKKRYIWIDSLCIYQDQDDKSDWLIEAPLMHKVYTHCYLNIAATGAKDSTEGLFATRLADCELKPSTIEWLPPSHVQSAEVPKPEYVLTDWLFLDRELLLAPLNQRAWVLQERLLSPRILHFGSRQLFWECSRGVLCERFPITLPSCMRGTRAANFSSLEYAYGKRVQYVSAEGLGDPEAVETGGSYSVWTNIVSAYSSSALTFPTDKLIALSGIAKIMEGRLNDQYVVGMWRRYLPSQLLWKVKKASQADGKPSNRPVPYRAPTWSWMSLDAQISPGKYTNEGLWFQVLSIDMDQTSFGGTDLVFRGSLKMKGRLRPLQLRKAIIDPFEADTELREKAEAKGLALENFRQEFAGLWIMKVGGKDLWLQQGESQERLGPLVFLDVPHANFEDSNRSQALYIMSAGGPWQGNNDGEFHDMLILECVDKKKGLFHRLGIATLDIEEKVEIFDSIKELDDCEPYLPCQSYDAEKHLHVITVE